MEEKEDRVFLPGLEGGLEVWRCVGEEKVSSASVGGEGRTVKVVCRSVEGERKRVGIRGGRLSCVVEEGGGGVLVVL